MRYSEYHDMNGLIMRLLPDFHEFPKGHGWSDLKKPVIVIDGHPYSWLPETPYAANQAFIVGASDKNFCGICNSLTTQTAYFYEMRVADISALETISGLRNLVIHWNTKLSDLSPLTGLDLATLALVHTPKVFNLDPVATLTQLKAFEFSGSPTLSSQNTAHTLKPIGKLNNLEELRLQGLRVKSGGLRPISSCLQLKRFEVSNTFETEDYAYLSAKLPNVDCLHFNGAVPIEGTVLGSGIDTMGVGTRKPFLNSKTEVERLRSYISKFLALKENHSGS